VVGCVNALSKSPSVLRRLVEAIDKERSLTVFTPIAADIARRSTERLARSATPDAPVLRPPALAEAGPREGSRPGLARRGLAAARRSTADRLAATS
jgi:hypothetical protein